ncbi:MAG: hypothetical protein WCQ77_05085 [Planctomycetota bacterium]
MQLTPHLLARIDARRPASWIALKMGATAGWWCGLAQLDAAVAAGMLAMLSVAVAVVAATGELPLDLCGATTSDYRGGPVFRPRGLAWACERAAWPLVGFLVGLMAVMLVAGGGLALLPTLALGLLGAVLAAVTGITSRQAGAKAADAASLTLAIAAASVASGATVGAAVESRCLFVASATGIVAWLLLGGVAWGWSRAAAAAAEPGMDLAQRGGPGSGVDVLHLDALPASGPLRQLLARLAMAMALVAMAGWLVLEPGRAAGDEPAAGIGPADAWALLSIAWFVALAVPQGILQDGVAGAEGWEHLFRTTPRPRGYWQRSWLRTHVPHRGPLRFAIGVALSQAAILGWPPLVCAVIAVSNPARSWPPAVIVLSLTAAAAMVTVIVMLGGLVRASRETMFAVTLAVIFGACLVSMWSGGVSI